MKESCLTDLRKRRIGAPTWSTSALKIGPGATGKSVVLFSQIVKEYIVFSRLVDLGRAPAAQADVRVGQSLVQIRPSQPKFLLSQSLPQTLQPSEFVCCSGDSRKLHPTTPPRSHDGHGMIDSFRFRRHPSATLARVLKKTAAIGSTADGKILVGLLQFFFGELGCFWRIVIRGGNFTGNGAAKVSCVSLSERTRWP